MKAFIFDGKAKLGEVPVPEPPPGEALVKVRLAGICKTDVEISRGYMEFHGTLGHEFIGEVIDDDDPKLNGVRVVGEINAACGSCEACSHGLGRHCKERTVLGIEGRDGAMAEYLTLPKRNLVPVAQHVSDEMAVFTEPLAAAVEILEQVKIRPDHRALVIGDGKLGLLVAMVVRLTGCFLLVAGKHPEKMEHVARLGVNTITLDDLSQRDDRFDVVVEASGNPAGWAMAVERVKPRGTIVQKSTYHGSLDFNPAPLVIDEITVVGSRCGQFAPALRLMAMGLVDPTPFITEVFSLEHAQRAFQRAQEPGCLKVLLKP